jgi:hypothetical protein
MGKLVLNSDNLMAFKVISIAIICHLSCAVMHSRTTRAVDSDHCNSHSRTCFSVPFSSFVLDTFWLVMCYESTLLFL